MIINFPRSVKLKLEQFEVEKRWSGVRVHPDPAFGGRRAPLTNSHFYVPVGSPDPMGLRPARSGDLAGRELSYIKINS
jgi:hypothetical protein